MCVDKIPKKCKECELFNNGGCLLLDCMLEDEDKQISKLEDYYWEQINKLDESYNKDLEKRLSEIEEKDKRIAELEQELAELKENAIVGQHLYMIPTQANGLKEITEYSLLEITLSDIGVRYHLKLIHKEKGIEPYFAASEKMFNVIIFATKQEAQEKLKEIKGV